MLHLWGEAEEGKVIDPFEKVDAPEMPNPLEQLTQELSRSMMWDMIGPINMRDNAEYFGQNPASMDVLEAEAKDMWKRKNALTVFGNDLPLFVSMASNAASDMALGDNPQLKGMPEELRAQFKLDNLKMSMLITGTVIGHMVQKGMIKYGDRYYELLGK